MSSNYPNYPLIAPVLQGVYRPFWSVMIPTYNCADYLVETLKSVLEQDPGVDEMQIEVVDNCSTEGNPEAIVKEIGKGRISFFRQSRNVGAVGNFNTCIQRANGHWIHILHSDDLILQDFYKTYKNLITLHSDATLLIGPSVYIDENSQPLGVTPEMPSNGGLVKDFSQLEAIQNWIQFPSVVIPRRIYEKVGGYCDQFIHTSDWDMWFRAGLDGKVLTLSKPYSCYRVHANNDTSRLVLTGDNIRDAVKAVDICLAKLSKQEQKRLAFKKYYYCSLLASKFSRKLAERQEYKASLIQAWLALKLWKTKSNFVLFLKTILFYTTSQLGIIKKSQAGVK